MKHQKPLACEEDREKGANRLKHGVKWKPGQAMSMPKWQKLITPSHQVLMVPPMQVGRVLFQ
jgi:hypothetical protein